jgi:hypothetical protein
MGVEMGPILHDEIDLDGAHTYQNVWRGLPHPWWHELSSQAIYRADLVWGGQGCGLILAWGPRPSRYASVVRGEGKMAHGFIDSASIHSALAVLKLQRTRDLSAWERQSLLETTYLLLFQDIGVIPGPGSYRGASGLYSYVVSGLPSLEGHQFRRDLALRSTRTWLAKDKEALPKAWNRLQSEPEFPVWSAMSRDLFWVDHVRMHTSLFNEEFIPHISRVLNCSEGDLRAVRARSESEQVVRQWLRTDLSADEATLANDAYVLAALIRGRFHEYVGSGSNLHLCSHPFRKSIGRPLATSSGEPVFNSEEYFVKVVVGSALLETTEERRVKAWVANLEKARKAIRLRGLALPHALLESDAERLAAEAARACAITSTYARVRRELDIAAALGIGGLALVAISPWLGLFGPFVPGVYRYFRGESIGDDLSRIAFDTTRRFRRLARATPGRIERSLRLPPSGAA